MQTSKAAFLDRDGVINRDKGYIYQPEHVQFLDGVFEACRRLNAAGYRIVIVTNQSGIGRGYYTEADFEALMRWMRQRFADESVEILDVYYCPDHPEYGIGRYRRESSHRKPGPGMLLDAAARHEIDLTDSIMVGDKLSDIQAGQAAGVRRCYFIGDGRRLPAGYETVDAFPDLGAAVESELARTNNGS